ncbi:helix-turn-helix domain-containing protein [Kibdelosporangium philippinense]|uniref:Helix-turn-helix domain-containing protein n=1 Tax=Kibdelosporangium philippinense TaxID=211113 RepID=A0ABS8Z3E0_9PSEU|nr:helix-turn-helix domain-containing protein [Kibdelosporangium philippinense]MCE7002451.1 helix-turn-helix domain-containing protein [Kibdelosporangium philippinense]
MTADIGGIDPLWTTDDVAQYLKIKVKTLRNWRSQDYGPPCKRIGKHVRYDPDTVREWFDQLGDYPDAA